MSERINYNFEKIENIQVEFNNISAKIYTNAISNVKYIKSMLINIITEQNYSNKIAIKHKVEWHRKMVASISLYYIFFNRVLLLVQLLKKVDLVCQ